ncbi:MAG TPA: S1/P1 nuclease [Candidatus Saccharimonadales bacterium]|nr:S1/P1 nuclease [Candidatus Saccharimonadales bacterium]
MKLAPSRFGLILFASFLFLLCSAPAWAWGCKGHQTVALIAEQNLTPEALQFVNKLLSENPVDPGLKRYCTDPAHDLLADASTWPDDVRNIAKNGPWHYIDIPRGAARAPLSEYCGSESCVTQAIADQVAILKDPHADPYKRADAIRYIVHFVGDLHMPLHATTNDDQGGNCVPVYFYWRTPQLIRNSYSPNLHFVWDVAILEHDMDNADPAEYAVFLSHSFAEELAKWRSAGIHVDDWAWESHDLAESVVYAHLSPKIPIEKPVDVHTCADDKNIGQRMLDLHVSAGEQYQESAAPVVRKRIAQAGLRLALILNDAAASASAKSAAN